MKKIALITALVIAMSIMFTSCNKNNAQPDANAANTENAAQASSDEPANAEGENEQPELPPVSENVITDEGFDQFAPPEKGDLTAVIKTNMGDIKIKFFGDDAPKAVENFTTHAKNGYYDGLTFCRVIDGFMIQAGSPTNDTRGGESIWNEPFEDEFSTRLHNYRGAVSMANSGFNTNGSQFFIVQAPTVQEQMLEYLQMVSEFEEAIYQDNRTGDIISGAQRFTQKSVDTYAEVGGVPMLDGGYPVQPEYRSWHTVFAQVYEGMDIVDAIAAVQTGENDKPLEDVVIISIDVIEI